MDSLEMTLQSPSCVPKKISVTGASGYIGKFLIEGLLARKSLHVKVLTRNKNHLFPDHDRLEIIVGDLLKPDTLEEFLDEDCLVINLAYSRGPKVYKNVEGVTNLLNSCITKKVKKIIHCSTATVEGPQSKNSRAYSLSEYSAVKLQIEKLIESHAKGVIDYAILRPSAVFGPDSQNLKKLSYELMNGNRVLNYLRCCLYGKRRMNLVHVLNVVEALFFLMDRPEYLGGERFVISDSDSPANNFLDVEEILAIELNASRVPIPRIIFPQIFIDFIIGLRSVDNINSSFNYSPRKILDLGLVRPVNLEDGLREYANYYKNAKK